MPNVELNINFSNLEYAALVKELQVTIPAKSRAAAVTAVRRSSSIVLAQVQRNVSLASDAPRGPGLEDIRKLTGRYYRSWKKAVVGAFGDSPEGTVFTDLPRARALEYGNPSNNQPPYPHAGKAFDQSLPVIDASLGIIVNEILQ